MSKFFMQKSFGQAMRNATRLIGTGKLLDATRLIQRALSGNTAPVRPQVWPLSNPHPRSEPAPAANDPQVETPPPQVIILPPPARPGQNIDTGKPNPAPKRSASFTQHQFKFEGDTYPYRLYVPAVTNASDNARMPLVVLLHGRARAAGLHSGGLFNLGEPDDFRIPDLGFHRTRDYRDYMPTAALVVEVLSPRDETFKKFGFYAAHAVDEVWVVDPVGHTVRIWQRDDEAFDESGRSDLLGLDADQVASDVDWP